MATDTKTTELQEPGRDERTGRPAASPACSLGWCPATGDDPAAMMPTVSALYGSDSTIVWWTAHLVHSFVFGLIFAAIATRTTVSRYAGRPGPSAVLGGMYGIVVWAVAAAIVMPLWIGMSRPRRPPFRTPTG